MNTLKKVLKKILYPHIIFTIVLFIVTMTLLVYSAINLSDSLIIYILYGLSFYSLLIFCLRIPNIIKYFKRLKTENKYVSKWFNDPHLRINVSLYGSFLWDFIYSIFQFLLGIYNKSFWFYTLSAYYFLLAIMRYYLSKHTKKYKAGEMYEMELKKYNFCGWMLLLMNIIVSVMIFFFIYWNKTFYHHEIITIAIATYTFIAFTVAIVNYVKYKKYKSFIYSIVKTISLVSASVSMMTLTVTMLTTFGSDSNEYFNKIMIRFVGAAVAIFIIVMAIIVIINSKKKKKELKETVNIV